MLRQLHQDTHRVTATTRRQLVPILMSLRIITSHHPAVSLRTLTLVHIILTDLSLPIKASTTGHRDSVDHYIIQVWRATLLEGFLAHLRTTLPIRALTGPRPLTNRTLKVHLVWTAALPTLLLHFRHRRFLAERPHTRPHTKLSLLPRRHISWDMGHTCLHPHPFTRLLRSPRRPIRDFQPSKVKRSPTWALMCTILALRTFAFKETP
jgi:hypothetical protein